MVFIVKMDTTELGCKNVNWIYQSVSRKHQGQQCNKPSVSIGINVPT
jgi:hypothetical protein